MFHKKIQSLDICKRNSRALMLYEFVISPRRGNSLQVHFLLLLYSSTTISRRVRFSAFDTQLRRVVLFVESRLQRPPFQNFTKTSEPSVIMCIVAGCSRTGLRSNINVSLETCCMIIYTRQMILNVGVFSNRREHVKIVESTRMEHGPLSENNNISYNTV